MSLLNPVQERAYWEVVKNFSFTTDSTKIDVTQGASYVHSPLFLHDYATGVIASAASALEHLGQVRGLPSQSIHLDRRLIGLHFNDWLSSYLNGQHLVFDSWGVGPDNGIYETKDGKWFSYVGDLARLKKEFSRYLDCPLIVESVRRAINEKNAQEIEDDMIKLGLPGGWMRSRQEWLDHPVGAYAKDTPIIEFEKHGNSHSRKLGQSKSRLLSGVRVLDLTNVIANPIGGRLLAEAGADVININPVTGDFILPTWIEGSWGKRNIRLDLKSQVGKQRFKELLSTADVLIDGHAPGAFERLGFDSDTLFKINPNLIRTGVSFAPRGSLWEKRRGFEQIAQTVTGVTHAQSEGSPEPHYTPMLINDYSGAYLLLAAVTAALAQREAEGGYWDAHISLIGNSTRAADFTGSTEIPEKFVEDDLIKYAVDQESDLGIWTNFTPAIDLSHTKLGTHVFPSLPGSSPTDISWLPLSDAEFEVPYYPSKLARDGRITGFFPNYGAEDRCDGPTGSISVIF